MRHANFAAKISYASIFAKSTEDASSNLVRLITTGDCGFDEGLLTWSGILAEYLDTPSELEQLNQFGASFTTDQWTVVLRQVRAALLAYMEPAR
jgi:hypothetical protein